MGSFGCGLEEIVRCTATALVLLETVSDEESR
jgi:hypothetical protein